VGVGGRLEHPFSVHSTLLGFLDAADESRLAFGKP
jgi:hypothetical protein